MIHGVGPANSAVQIVTSDCEPIAETKTNGNGGWEVPRVYLEAGEHEIRAIVTDKRGRRHFSPMLTLEVCPDESESQIADADPATLLTAEERQDYLDFYEQYVDARANGYEVDMRVVLDLLPWAGKSSDDFYGDVLAQIEVNERLIALGADPNDF